MRTRSGILMVLVLIGGVALASGADQTGAAASGSTATATDQSAADFQQMRADIQKLHADARTQIRALLTPEQQTKFDTLGVLDPQCRGPGFGPQGAAADVAGPGRHDRGGGPGDPTRLVQRLTKDLSLSDTQVASVQTILDKQHAAVQARHEQARTDFRALLTPEQTAKLDALKGSDAEGLPHPGRGHGFRATGNALQLTDEQKAQADAIFTQVRTDVEKLRADGRQQIRELLTDEQKAKFDTLPAPGTGPLGKGGACGNQAARGNGGGRMAGKMRGPHGGARGLGMAADGRLLERLTTELSLTDTQRASIQTILDNLRTSVQSRVHAARDAAGQ